MPLQRIHLDVEKQELRPLGADGRQAPHCRRRIRRLREVALRLAEFAQRAPPGELVVDDDDVHHSAPPAERRRGDALRGSGGVDESPAA